MPLINVKTAFYLNETLFNLSINTKVLFMAFPKTLDNKDIHSPLIAATFILVNPRPLRHRIKDSQSAAMLRYQDPLFQFYQNPQCMQNNLLLPPPPLYSSPFLDENRICNPSQPCFMTKQTGAFTQPESFNSSVASQLPFNYSTDPRTLLPTSSRKLSIPGKFNSFATTFNVAVFLFTSLRQII